MPPSPETLHVLQMPVAELLAHARMGVRLFPTIDGMLDYMADSMAEELRVHNTGGLPTRWILPVGPVKQYFRLVDRCNAERISWRNADIFQMDEFLDWQGRPVAVDHPLSFEGFMRSQVFGRL